MKPIRYITYRDTVWYNVMDYIRLLLDTNTIWRVRPVSPRKRRRLPKSPEHVLLDKINRLNPAYQIQINQEIYVDWVVFEHLYRLLKPFLVQPTDWTNPNSLFRQTQLFINRTQRLSESLERTVVDTYFKEVDSA